MGNTESTTFPSVSEAVHPHVCGEHTSCSWTTRAQTGSSPRLWGTPEQDRGRGHALRFIPTPVGNTDYDIATWPSTTVHPHACGEHTATSITPVTAAGSSPRLWGTPEKRAATTGPARFIPTPVGNTSIQSLIPDTHTVHPHACGEHACGSEVIPPTPGSSPRLWGTRHIETGT